MEESNVMINTEDGQLILVKGLPGEKGADGKDGIDGRDGTDGRDGVDGERGLRGYPGEDGKNGKNGKDGKDGVDGKSVTLEEVMGEVLKSQKPEKGKIDQRWHGGGLSKVSTDATLTGLGTPSSPLSVVGSAGTQIWNETVSFSGFTGTLANTPTAGTVRLYRGGARQQPGAGNDYTVSGSVITLAQTAQTGEIFIADYSK